MDPDVNNSRAIIDSIVDIMKENTSLIHYNFKFN